MEPEAAWDRCMAHVAVVKAPMPRAGRMRRFRVSPVHSSVDCGACRKAVWWEWSHPDVECAAWQATRKLHAHMRAVREAAVGATMPAVP